MSNDASDCSTRCFDPAAHPGNIATAALPAHSWFTQLEEVPTDTVTRVPFENLGRRLRRARNDPDNLDIVQQDRDGTTLRRWSLARAWPVKFVASEWDNEADENVIESVTLTYDPFELVQ